jgi:hypothetical protein
MKLFFAPFDLTLLELRLFPASFLRNLFGSIAIALASGWLIRELRRQPVLDARMKLGRRNHALGVPVLLGFMASVAACIFVSIGLSRDNTNRAKAAVAEQLGRNYKYFVNHVNIGIGPFGKLVSASVIAYNQQVDRALQSSSNSPSRRNWPALEFHCSIREALPGSSAESGTILRSQN